MQPERNFIRKNTRRCTGDEEQNNCCDAQNTQFC